MSSDFPESPAGTFLSPAGSTERLPRWMDGVFALWRRLAEFPASETDAALDHLMEWIAAAIDADNVIWIGAARVLPEEISRDDPFFGWRLRVRRPLRPDPEDYQKLLASYYNREHYGKLTPTYYDRPHEDKRAAHIGMTGQASLAGAGRFRVHRMRDGWIDFKAFRRTLHYRLYYRDAGITDRMTIGFPVGDGLESFFLIDRFARKDGSRRRNFSLHEATLAGTAVRGIPELHRRLFLGNGLSAGDKPLSPMERQILHGLLTGKAEKEIAESTGQKPATTHKYITSLYARFGVKGRAALMALWLSGGRPPSI